MTFPLPDIADAVVIIAEATATHPPGTPLDDAGNPLPVSATPDIED